MAAPPPAPGSTGYSVGHQALVNGVGGDGKNLLQHRLIAADGDLVVGGILAGDLLTAFSAVVASRDEAKSSAPSSIASSASARIFARSSAVAHSGSARAGPSRKPTAGNAAGRPPNRYRARPRRAHPGTAENISHVQGGLSVITTPGMFSALNMTPTSTSWSAGAAWRKPHTAVAHYHCRHAGRRRRVQPVRPDCLLVAVGVQGDETGRDQHPGRVDFPARKRRR